MNKRFIWAAGGVVAIVVAVLVALSVSGGEADAEGAATDGITGVAAVEAQLRGIRQQGNVLGNAGAPVEIIEYGDLACPACKLASETTVPDLVTDVVREGRATLEFRPIAFISPSSERGALAAEAAAEQDAMWSLIEVLYRNQGDERTDWLSDEMLEETVAALGLDLEDWRDDYRSAAIAQRFVGRARQATDDQVSSTPTFVVRGPRGERTVTGAVEAGEIAAAVTAVGPR